MNNFRGPHEGPRVPLKHMVQVGTEFRENGHDCSVTRVTDLHFDTLDKETGRVAVRSLASR